MNTQTQLLSLPHERHAAYRISIELATLLHRCTMRRGRTSLRDQLMRSCDSIALNIAEGTGRAGKDRFNFFKIARGSACEVAAALDLLVASQALDQEIALEARDLCGRLYALLTRMARLG